MRTITLQFLQTQVDKLNRVTGSPLVPYLNGKAQIGCYHLSGAYGGYSLERIENEGGGVSSPLNTGHIPKRQLSELLSAFTRGVESAQEKRDAEATHE